jgi:hypothetical protein
VVSFNAVEKKPEFRQHRLNNRPLPHGHRSLRPSFSFSSLSPWTSLRPSLTCVSLRVASTPFRHDLERIADRREIRVAWSTSYGILRIEIAQVYRRIAGSFSDGENPTTDKVRRFWSAAESFSRNHAR